MKKTKYIVETFLSRQIVLVHVHNKYVMCIWMRVRAGALKCGVMVRGLVLVSFKFSLDSFTISEIRARWYFYCAPHMWRRDGLNEVLESFWLRKSYLCCYGSRCGSFKVFLPSIFLYIFCVNPKQEQQHYR